MQQLVPEFRTGEIGTHSHFAIANCRSIQCDWTGGLLVHGARPAVMQRTQGQCIARNSRVEQRF